MRQMFRIVSTFKEYFVFAACLTASIALLSFNNNQQIRAVRSITIAFVGVVQDAFTFVPDYFDLKEENRILRERNLNLSSEVSLLRESKLENIRLRQLLGLKERNKFAYVSGKVVGRNVQMMRNTITVDVGESQGVGINMPVVNDAGLVGRIVATSANYSIGQLLTNKDLRVSARIQRSRADGIIAWEGGELLNLMHVPKSVDVRNGDLVLTSEYSTLFPAGLKIGLVAAVKPNPGAMFHMLEIIPAADLARIEEVFIIKHTADQERSAIQKPSLK